MTLPTPPELKYLFSATVELQLPPLIIGTKIVLNTRGGVFEGPELNGEFLHTGGDWVTIREDGSMALDIRGTMQTDDGELINVVAFGRMVLPPEMNKMDPSQRHTIDPSQYYFRTAPLYETASEKYAWLNHIQAVATCQLTATGITFQAYQVL